MHTGSSYTEQQKEHLGDSRMRKGMDFPSGGALYIMFENHVRSWPLLKTP